VRRVAALAGVAGVALLVAGAPSAQAGCGGVQTAAPSGHRHAGVPPLAIGDSTMLLAMPYLAREGFAVNAHGCRQYDEALALLRHLRGARLLPHLVLVALGADGSITRSDVDQTLSIMGSGRILVLVTPRELGGGSGSDAATVRLAGRRHPGRVRVLDWVAYASGHGGWFQPDGLHLTFTGAAAFAGFLRPALAVAFAPTTLTVSGRLPVRVGVPASAVDFRTRLTVPSGWAVSGRHVHAGAPDVDLITPGACAFHLRLSARAADTAPPAAAADHLRALVPAGARRGDTRRGPDRSGGLEPALWTAWRGGGAVGGAWSLDLGPSPGSGTGVDRSFLDWTVATARGGHCPGTASRQAQAQTLGLLASLRVSG
jgi:hypothetical protein